MDEWGKVFVEAGRRFGRPFDVVGEGVVEKAFEEAGFEGITVWNSKVGTSGCCFGEEGADGGDSARLDRGPRIRRPRRLERMRSWRLIQISRVSLENLGSFVKDS